MGTVENIPLRLLKLFEDPGTTPGAIAGEVKIVFYDEDAVGPICPGVPQDREVAFEAASRSQAGEVARVVGTTRSQKSHVWAPGAAAIELIFHFPPSIGTIDQVDYPDFFEVRKKVVRHCYSGGVRRDG